MLDAKNENVYYALYTLTNNLLTTLIAPTFDNVTNAISNVISKVQLSNILFVGNGVKANLDKLTSFQSNIKVNLENILPDSKHLIELVKMEQNLDNSEHMYNYKEFKPIYLRLSQAERSTNDK